MGRLLGSLSHTGLILTGLILAALPASASAADKPKVVATFSILGDLVSEVAGGHVEVTTLVGPNGDAHVFEPGPKESAALAEADLLVANGLGFESWLERLSQAAGFKGTLVTATDGVASLPAEHEEHEEGEVEEAEGEHDHDHGAFDPHAFQDLANGQIYVANIAKGLSQVDPVHAAEFEANARKLSAEMAALDAQLKADFAAIPQDRRRVLTSHDAFRYFARAYGVDFVAIHGVSTEAEPTAKDLAEIVQQARGGNIKAIFLENMSDPRLIETVAGETDLTVGGELYADALSEKDGPAPDYLSLFRYNAEQLLAALR
ncbi:MAG TPA: zinc ABC transporter substrate-binding protein [Dongiaceae bacterium]|nr:zinc ABC transporter substrate-binding protein [Dongiaceae bacterium]